MAGHLCSQTQSRCGYLHAGRAHEAPPLAEELTADELWAGQAPGGLNMLWDGSTLATVYATTQDWASYKAGGENEGFQRS